MNLESRTINPNKKIVMARRLPVPGEVLVQRGQQVAPLQVIARTELPRRHIVLNIEAKLGVSDIEVNQFLQKEVGDFVAANEIIAARKSRMPFGGTVVKSPVAGQIVALQQGLILIETQPAAVELHAFIHGLVKKIIPGYGAVIETGGALIAAACGFGGETYGPLHRLVDNPGSAIAADDIHEGHQNLIVLAGRTINLPILRRAHQAGVRGLIAGSFDASLRRVRTNVVVTATEGFGDIPVSPYTFGVLATLTGKDISIRGSLPALTTGPYPEDPPLIVTSTAKNSRLERYGDDLPENADLEIGSRVRIIRGRMMGAAGVVDTIPAHAQQIDTGQVIPGVLIKIDNTRHYVPRANLELIT